ncbi:MAG: amino acid ABC transporter permease [Caulobacteraceae bacterium]
MALDLAVVRDNLGYLLVGRAASGEPGGLLLTLILSAAAGLLALVIGVALALAAWIFGGWTRRLLFLWSDLIRAVPLVLVIFWLFFLLPALFGDTPGWLTVVLALAWFTAASVMHSTLAGLQALPKTQMEAALASGLSPVQALRLVLLPQAVPNILPSLLGLFVALIKDTSLAFIVNVPELTTVATQVNNQTQVYPAEIFLTVALLYLIPTGGLSLLMSALTRKRAPQKRPIG